MKTVFLDMDGVIANFVGSIKDYNGFDNYLEMYEVGFFENLQPVDGALVSVRHLLKHCDVWILSQPVKESAHSYSEKVKWIMKWFPELTNKITLTQEKSHLSKAGHYLIDDNANRWQKKWLDGGGEFIHFDEHNPVESWAHVLRRLEITRGQN